MLDRNIDKVERIIELTSNSGKKEQFRVGDIVDINYRKPFDPRGVGHKDDIVQDLKKAQEFIQFEIDAIEGTRAERKDKPKHEDFMDAMLRGLFGGSVGHIEITGKRNGKTDEEIAEIVDKTIKDIISGMAGVELEEIKEGNGYTEVHITGNANPIEVREYIERELKDRLAIVL